MRPAPRFEDNPPWMILMVVIGAIALLGVIAHAFGGDLVHY